MLKKRIHAKAYDHFGHRADGASVQNFSDAPGKPFGVAAVQASIPLNLVQRWMGHAQLSTTAIYAEAMGKEERDMAARMWR